MNNPQQKLVCPYHLQILLREKWRSRSKWHRTRYPLHKKLIIPKNYKIQNLIKNLLLLTNHNGQPLKKLLKFKFINHPFLGPGPDL